jgi:hypothetical protein
MKTSNRPNIKRIARHLESDNQIKAYQARQALAKLEADLGAATMDKERAKACEQIVEILTAQIDVIDPKKPKDKPKKEPKYAAESRNLLIRALATLGRDTEVSALETALDDFETREMARWSLDRMTCERASEVLAEAATKKVGDEFRIGVINSLGRKPTDDTIIAALKKCHVDNELEVRLAAVEALANHGDASFDALIAAVGKPPKNAAINPRTKLRISKARMRLAEQLAKAGDKESARKIYQQLAADGAEGAQKKAADLALKSG